MLDMVPAVVSLEPPRVSMARKCLHENFRYATRIRVSLRMRSSPLFGHEFCQNWKPSWYTYNIP